MAFTYNWTTVTDGMFDAESPGNEVTMQAVHHNLVHLREWMGKSYYATATEDHDHDDQNSKAVAMPDGALTLFNIHDIESKNISVLQTTLYHRVKTKIPSNAQTLNLMAYVRRSAGAATAVVSLYCNGLESAPSAGVTAVAFTWVGPVTLDVSSLQGGTHEVIVKLMSTIGGSFAEIANSHVYWSFP